MVVFPAYDGDRRLRRGLEPRVAQTQTRHEMLKSASKWLIAGVGAVLLAAVASEMLKYRQSQRALPSKNVAEQSFVIPAQGDAGARNYAEQPYPPQATGNPSGLHQRILRMTEPQRNHILYLIIRDTGSRCTEVVSSEHIIAESSVWHAYCANAQNYSVSIDSFGSTSVRSIPYEDVAPGILIEPR